MKRLEAQGENFPVAHSILSQDALATLVQKHYSLESAITCTLLNRGVNDIYLVSGRDNKYILRVSPSSWRSQEDIRWELELLEHVSAKGVAVSEPIKQSDGSLSQIVDAPEGPRIVALFSHLAGRRPDAEIEDGAKYGAAVARLHSALDDFPNSHHRFQLTLEHLIDDPLKAIQPWLKPQPETWQQLSSFGKQIKKQFETLSPKLEWGACHGDLHNLNARVDSNGDLSLFDFDCGGMGYRAYDLSVYLWAIATYSEEPSENVWHAFLEAYTKERPLGRNDLDAIPLFVASRSLWFMGLYATFAPVWGFNPIEDGFFDYGLKFLKRWEKTKLN